MKPGDPYTPENVRGQIKILYETGFFEDVQVETESGKGGVALAFLVREKPFITEIVFDGNKDLSDDKLKEKITIKSQSFLDQPQAKESAEKIRLAYQGNGYFNSQVIPVVQTLDEDRKRLTFFVKEGDKARVKTVKFDGLHAATKNEMFQVMAELENNQIVYGIVRGTQEQSVKIPMRRDGSNIATAFFVNNGLGQLADDDDSGKANEGLGA